MVSIYAVVDSPFGAVIKILFLLLLPNPNSKQCTLLYPEDLIFLDKFLKEFNDGSKANTFSDH